MPSNTIKLGISTCNRRTDEVYKYRETDWDDFAKSLETPKRTAETVETYKTMTKDEQSTIKDVGGFVLGDLIDGKPSKQTVRNRSGIALDLDHAPADCWDQFTTLFEGAAVMYSTHKHTPETPKYRLLIPLSRPVSPDEYEAIARKITSDYLNLEWADDTTFQPSRLMFFPSTSSDGVYEYHRQNGEPIDPQTILNRYTDGLWNDISRWEYSSRVQRARAAAPYKRAADPTTKKGPVGNFCRAYTIQEAIEEFLPEVYEPTASDNRWTYTKGSTAGGLVIYDSGQLAYSNHASDPTGDMHCVNAFDLVRIHLYRQLDTDPSLVGKNSPSYKAMAELCAEDPKVQQTLADQMFSAQVAAVEADYTGISAEQFETKNREWQGQLTRNAKTGEIEETLENCVIIMKNDIKLKGMGGLNEFTQDAEKTGPLPWYPYNPGDCIWKEEDTLELRLYMEKLYGIRSEKLIKSARDITHTRAKFHPVREYLDSLEWDGVPRLDTLLVDYLGATDSAYTRAVTRKTFTAAVARVYEPGKKFDQILTLAGDQGIGKSYFIRVLGGDKWTNDSITTFSGKEAYDALQGSWLIELGELVATKKAEVEQVKQFISKQSDKYRKAYAEKSGVYPRQCVFFGTSNQDDFLRDMTGNRRWWIVPVNSNGKKSIFNDLPVERDQIFAEAKIRYQEGESLFLDKELSLESTRIQNRYTFQPAQLEMVSDFLEMDLPANWKDMDLMARRMWLDNTDHPDNPGVEKRQTVCTMEIWQECYGNDKRSFPNQQQREIGALLSRLGWIKSDGPRKINAEYGKQRYFYRPEKQD